MERKTLTIQAVADYVGISRAGIYRLIQAGDLPKPQQLSPRRVFFLKETVDAWLASLPEAA